MSQHLTIMRELGVALGLHLTHKNLYNARYFDNVAASDIAFVNGGVDVGFMRAGLGYGPPEP